MYGDLGLCLCYFRRRAVADKLTISSHQLPCFGFRYNRIDFLDNYFLKECFVSTEMDIEYILLFSLFLCTTLILEHRTCLPNQGLARFRQAGLNKLEEIKILKTFSLPHAQLHAWSHLSAYRDIQQKKN